MALIKLRCVKHCLSIGLFLIVISQSVCEIKHNYTIGFENVHHLGGRNDTHGKSGSGHGGHRLVSATPPSRNSKSRATLPTNMHKKPDRTVPPRTTLPPHRINHPHKYNKTSTTISPIRSKLPNTNHPTPGHKIVTKPPPATLPPILPPRLPRPVAPLNLSPANGSQPRVIYLNKQPPKGSSDWDDFDSFLRFLRRTSSNSNQHKKLTKVVNGQRIYYYYITRDYYHNSDKVPKVIEVKKEALKSCAEDTTKAWCVPNTYSMCSLNGPIMCVAYMTDTVPCGNDSCVITKHPCDKNAPSCSRKYDLFTYMPCVSHVKILPAPTSDFYQNLTATVIELCAVSIIEPTLLESPLGSITKLFVELGKSHVNTLFSYKYTHK